MTQDEIDIMWQQAMKESIKDGEMYTRYHFAKLVAEAEREACKALAKEHAAEYKEGGRLYPMLNRDITKTAATACDHIVYIIGKRG
jgi:hypothetical protein